jgi:hypothetical protein
MLRISKLTCALTIVGLLASTASNAAELITNGDFETGDFTGWTVTDLSGGSGSWFVNSGFNTPISGFSTSGAAGGAYYAISDQTGPGTHALSQAFTVSAGNIVTLSFDMFVNDQSGVGPIIDSSGLDYTSGGSFASNQHARVDILAAGSGSFDTGAGVLANFYLGVDSGSTDNPYTHYSFDISSLVGSGGSFIIRFAEVDNRSFLHQGIDNVSILAVPEPETYAMLLVGLGFLSFVTRRRFTI